MKKILFIVLFVVFSTSTLAEPIWEVQKNGNKIYVIGSVHAAKPSRPPLSPFIKKVIENAELVYFESDPKGGADLRPVPTLGISTLDSNMYADLVGEVISEASVHLKYCFGNDLSRLRTIDPWRWIVECDVQWILRSGMDVNFGTESLIMRQVAGTTSILTAGLEGINYLVGVLSAIPPDHWLRFFRQNVADQGPMEKIVGIEEQVNDTLFASEESIESSIHESWYSTAQKRAVSAWMIDHRNVEFFSQMSHALANRKSTVFVVGKSHTLGPSGVISKFRAIPDVSVKFICN